MKQLFVLIAIIIGAAFAPATQSTAFAFSGVAITKTVEPAPAKKEAAKTTTAKKGFFAKAAKWFKSLADGDKTLAIILSILFPCIGVLVYENGITTHFWIALLLQLLFWVPGIIFALLVVLDVVK